MMFKPVFLSKKEIIISNFIVLSFSMQRIVLLRSFGHLIENTIFMAQNIKLISSYIYISYRGFIF